MLERDEWEDFIRAVDSLISPKPNADKPAQSAQSKPTAPAQDLKTTPSGDDKPVKVTMTPDGKYATETYAKREPPKKHGEHLPRYVGKVRCIDSAGDRCQLFVRVEDPEKESPNGRPIIHIGFALDGDAECPDDYYLDITAEQSGRLRDMLAQAETACYYGDVADVE